jgi:endonuclease/exonuclease/phosphatase (EEP) superfamily protein YafD
MSMAMAGIIKKYKRTLVNFQEDFMIPFINKAAYRYMQFDPERYPSVDMTFLPTATLGILAREFEQQQMIGLLQTLGPTTPVLPLILKGILSNSSLTNRAELMTALEKMSQPDPEQQKQQQEAAQQAQQAQMALIQAQVQDLQAAAQKKAAESQQIQVDTQLAPQLVQAKLTAALATNLNEDNESKDFERRARMTELMLKERDLNIKEDDNVRNERITTMQMQTKNQQKADFSAAMED